MRRIGSMMVAVCMAAPALTGCNAYRLKPPAGFAEVSRDEWGVRMKGSDDVGLNLRVWNNVKGGTLAFWSEDLVRKLGRRGYTLQRQTPIESDNGVAGTRFDFSYTSPEKGQQEKFFTVLLFVTDKHKVAVQLAGDAEAQPRIGQQVADIAAETKVRGCRPWTKVCDGPQPGKLETVSPPDREDEARDEAKDDELAEKTEAEPEASQS